MAKTFIGRSHTIVSTSRSRGPCHVEVPSGFDFGPGSALFATTNSKCRRQRRQTVNDVTMQNSPSISKCCTELSYEGRRGGEWNRNADVRFGRVEAVLLLPTEKRAYTCNRFKKVTCMTSQCSADCDFGDTLQLFAPRSED